MNAKDRPVTGPDGVYGTASKDAITASVREAQGSLAELDGIELPALHSWSFAVAAGALPANDPSDVLIDLFGYRRYGHNEGDEPAFTQPKMYSLIADHVFPFLRTLGGAGVLHDLARPGLLGHQRVAVAGHAFSSG